MIDSVNGNINDAQNDHLKGYRWEKFTDIHCHCLAGLDDGPATMAESLALCRRLAEEDIATVVATPCPQPERIAKKQQHSTQGRPRRRGSRG